ncbi:MAG: DUF255 domain-containing protein [Lewinellaceae bacterium]|nr:DUF255 domain-containing protein [Phaeodactylibacter sp.]MCB9040851.1 DUF255 domain-containing protein [Lewinellaceae bacterium]
MKRISVILTVLLAWSALSFTPVQQTQKLLRQDNEEGVKWLSWEEAMALSQTEKKKILLNVYTDWCGWCKRMDKATFEEPNIARYINDNFYPVKFDAEQRNELEYKGKTYKYVKNGQRGYHELAAELLKGRLSFPTVVFLDEHANVIQSIVGYKSPQQFERIATYFAGGHYKKTPWSTYQATYRPVLVSD